MDNELLILSFWSDEKLQKLKALAACHWSRQKMAKYFGVTLKVFNKLMEQPEAKKVYDQGSMEYQALADLETFKAMEQGSVTAIQIYHKESAKKRFNNSIREVFFNEK